MSAKIAGYIVVILFAIGLITAVAIKFGTIEAVVILTLPFLIVMPLIWAFCAITTGEWWPF